MICPSLLSTDSLLFRGPFSWAPSRLISSVLINKLTLTLLIPPTIVPSLYSSTGLTYFLSTASIVSAPSFSAFRWYLASCSSTESSLSRSPNNQELVLRFCILFIIWHSAFLGPRYPYLLGVTGHYIVLVSLPFCLDAVFHFSFFSF